MRRCGDDSIAGAPLADRADTDDRVRCGRCEYGGREHCPNVAPLPVDMRHHCDHFEARPADAPDAVATGHDEPGGLALVQHKRESWLRFVADTRAQDAAADGPATRSTPKPLPKLSEDRLDFQPITQESKP